jgi:hypothetical protein
MKEQSQLDAMRAAVRGDLERAQARRDADPWRTPEPEPEPIEAHEAEREPELPFAPEPEPEPEPVAEVEPEPEPEPLAPPASDTKPGFFSRLFR